MPVSRERIEPGTVFGWFTFIKDLPDTKSNRMVQVRCKCGTYKNLQFAHIKSGNNYTCGKIGCKIAYNQYLDRLIELKLNESKGIKLSPGMTELSNLTKYWREIERTGNVQGCANGHLLTRQFLTGNQSTPN